MADTENRLLKNKKVLSYPTSIGASVTDAHGNPSQYMMIKISIDENSTKLRSDGDAGQKLITNSRTGIGVATTVVNSSTFEFIDEFRNKALQKDVDPDIRLQYGEAAANSEKWRVQKGMRRLDKVIILPMPNEHNVGTAIKYNSDFDPGLLTKIGDVANQSGGDIAAETAKYAKNAGMAWGINGIKNAITTKGGDITSTRSMLAEDRAAVNPRQEVMFDGISYRQFTFRYTFAPRNEVESRMVNEIIETLRYYALPEISPAKVFFKFPGEFDVSFMLGEKHNPNIPKMTTSVLQRVGVNYAPNGGVWSSLPNGAPTAVDVTLDFMELTLVDRGMVWNPDSEITSGY
jgi:hypothetical protein